MIATDDPYMAEVVRADGLRELTPVFVLLKFGWELVEPPGLAGHRRSRPRRYAVTSPNVTYGTLPPVTVVVMTQPLHDHPGVLLIDLPRRAFQCPRCLPEHGDDWWSFTRNSSVPLADGVTIVCWRHATEAERRNRWCETCHEVKDEDEFDRGRMSCRACLAPPSRERTCEHCGASFTASRSDAR